MMKEVNVQGSCIKPMPKVIVSCRDKQGFNNALVVAYASNVSINPAMVMVGIVPTRFSYNMIKQSGEFIINLPAKSFENEYKYLGSKSGRDGDKFVALNLKWKNGSKVDAPILTDCLVSIECKVVESIKPGTHELFIATVEAIHCDEKSLDENGNIDWDKIDLL